MTDTWALDAYKKAKYDKLPRHAKLMHSYGAKYIVHDLENTTKMLRALDPYEPYTEEERFRVDDLRNLESQYWSDLWEITLIAWQDITVMKITYMHRNNKGFCVGCSDGSSEDYVAWPCETAKVCMGKHRKFQLSLPYPKRRKKPVGKGTVTYEIKHR